jgi:release factor glutamine methyltransferase
MCPANVKYLSLLMTIQETRKELAAGINSIYHESEAGNIADLLLEHYTGLSRTELTIKRDILLNNEQASSLANAEKRLLQHEPVQYIINEAWFYGLKFYVDKNVLIPRPETEELVDWVISNIKFPFENLRILDIGTGSGCIPISLKRKLRKADVWSCDIIEAALSVAQKNANELGAAINFLQLNFLTEAETASLPSFDIIISNPPYVPENNKAEMNKNVLDFEPHTALFVPDSNTLLFYKAIHLFAQKHLSENGSVFLELHADYANLTQQLFLHGGFEKVEVKKDMQGKERFLHANKH